MTDQPPIRLSPRETEVLQLLSLGVPYKTIQSRLSISLGTVRVYAKAAREKLGAQSNAQAVRLAIENGIIKL